MIKSYRNSLNIIGDEMNLKDKTLEILLNNAGEPISGEDIAEKLGVSRNSIWKSINKLKESGYKIEAVTNKGYTLISEGDFLTESAIERYIKTDFPIKLEIHEIVSSTQTVLKEYAEKGVDECYVLIANSQSSGKGRLGRNFSSPSDTGLYMSLLLRPKFSPENALYITTAAAVAVAQAIEEITGIVAEIKWVNDVYVKGKKVCGILTEASIDIETGGLSYAVVGIGVNIRVPENGFDKEIKDVATALYQDEIPEGTRAKLAAKIIDNFLNYYENLESKTFIDEYKKRSFLTGMHITFLQGINKKSGTVESIDDDARIVIKLDSGETESYSSGEVIINKDWKKEEDK